MINFDLIQARVYVGSGPINEEDVARLKQMKITSVISLQTDEDLLARETDWQQLQAWYQGSEINALRFPIKDFDEADMTAKIVEPIMALNKLLDDGQRIYIHCNTGICRAPAVVLGYLCHFEKMSVGEAMRQIQIARPIASPFRTAVKKALEELPQKTIN